MSAIFCWSFAAFFFVGIQKKSWRQRWGKSGRRPYMSGISAGMFGSWAAMFGFIAAFPVLRTQFIFDTFLVLFAALAVSATCDYLKKSS
jgi:hypothetical protein